MALSFHHRGHDIDDFFRDLIPLLAGGAVTTRPNRNSLTTHLRPIPVDFSEDDKQYQILADIPGVSKESIKLDIDGDVVTLGVEHKEEQEEKQEKEGFQFHRVERSSQYRSRALRVPEDSDVDKVDAKLENGVLTITLPKKPVKPAEAAKRVKIA